MHPLGTALYTFAALEIVEWVTYTAGATSVGVSAAAALVLVAGAAQWLRSADAPELPLSPGTQRLLGLLPVAAAVHALWARHVLDWEPMRLRGFPTFGAILLLTALAVLRRWPRATLALVFVTGLLLRHLQFSLVPISERHADMLPLVRDAVDAFVRGEAPYHTYYLPWEVQLTSLPLSWLAFAPLRLLGVDIRWTNTACVIAVLLAIVHAVGARPRATEWFTGLWGTWFLSDRVLDFETIATAPVHWAALAWGASAIVRRSALAPVLVGLALATTPLAILLLPFLPTGALPTTSAPAPLTRRLLPFARAFAVAGALVLPWIIQTPRAFVDGAVLWFGDITRMPTFAWRFAHAWASDVGFSALFFAAGMERALQPIQLTSTSIVVLLARRLSRPPASALVATHLVFMVFNPVVWPYLYEPAYVYAMIAALAVSERRLG
jgi:hypothetical protein